MDRLKLQLTQMKNENELLRSQVIKAANQADVAEKRLEETLKVSLNYLNIYSLWSYYYNSLIIIIIIIFLGSG